MQILKGLNAEMKATDAEFKATGNAEKALEQKTKTLNSQLNVQKGIIDKAEKALKVMRDEGVEPTDTAYQKLYATLMNATAGMNETQAALNNLTASEQTAADGANELTNSVNGIGKKISLGQVISGIDSITGGLEKAAMSAVHLGEELVSAVLNKAKLADDTATMAEMYGISVERLLKMNQMYASGFDTSADAILSAQDKLRKGLGSGDTVQILNDMGIAVSQFDDGGNGSLSKARDSLEIFFEAGQKILSLGENEQVDIAQKLFGRSWRDLAPLFDSYKTIEEYETALDGVQVASEGSVKNLVNLNDTVGKLKGNLDTLTTEILGALAPALTEVAGSLSNLLSEVIRYLQTEDGQEMMKSLSDSVSSLFEDLGKIDPKEVVKSFTTVFNDLVSGLQWIVENKSTLVGALQAIVVGWGGLSLFGGALQILKLIEGLQGLGIIGGGKAAADAASGTASGGNWLSGVMPGIGSKLPALASWTSVNGGPVLDWLTHESPLGTIFQGVESIGDWWSRMLKEQQERTDTFGDNWNPNSADANVIMKNAGNTIRFWDDFWSQVFTGGTGWNWGPQQEGTGSDWTDEEAQNLADAIAKRTEEMEGVTVDVEPEAPIDSAQKISEQIGTVQVPVQLLIRGGGSGMVPFPIEGFHANGLPFVPFDNYLALLHRGERVIPAREVASRNFSSNLYVENMNMSGGMTADALAAAIASRNSRIMAGYGS
jgi:hypothetical protein